MSVANVCACAVYIELPSTNNIYQAYIPTFSYSKKTASTSHTTSVQPPLNPVMRFACFRVQAKRMTGLSSWSGSSGGGQGNSDTYFKRSLICDHLYTGSFCHSKAAPLATLPSCVCVCECAMHALTNKHQQQHPPSKM